MLKNSLHTAHTAIFIFIALLIYSAGNAAFCQQVKYSWLISYDSTQSIINRIEPPEGYTRVPVAPGSFADWLRKLPLKEGNPPIYLHDGRKKFMQAANYAVVNIDVGGKDLQQCADAVMRLRAEYLFAQGHVDSIAFNFTSGDRFVYSEWLEGKTPVINQDEVSWQYEEKRENNCGSFKQYLNIVFTYAGSYSLSKELKSVGSIDSIQIGDVFIEGGFPGHAVLVVDLVENSETGERRFLIAQSYMPAQDIHIIKKPLGSPWFSLGIANRLWTLEWVFDGDELMRFR